MGWSAAGAALAEIVLVLVPLAVAVEEDGRRGGGSNVHQLRADFSFSNLTQSNITSAPPPPSQLLLLSVRCPFHL